MTITTLQLQVFFSCSHSAVVEDANPQGILCGVPALGRIMGGTDSQSGQWPWQASLNLEGTHVCGATLIAPQWLLTAAHCFPRGHSPTDYEVSMGNFQLKNPTPDLSVKVVAEVIKHPRFTEEEGSTGDIALVKLNGPVTYTRTIRPICLPSSSVDFPNGMKCTVTGWGNVLTSTSLLPPMTLQQLEVPIITRNACQCLYNRTANSEDPDIIHSDMMCAGFAEGKKDACQGDSGGPLSCRIGNAWLLAGVVSWGDTCGAANRPGVYIRASTYADWIKENIPEVELKQVTSDVEPVSEESMCPNAVPAGQPGLYDGIQPHADWPRPISPNEPPSDSAASWACTTSLPLLFLLFQSLWYVL
uniref:Serine protease 8 n=1 Tax=Salvator merianae TaxID=96440 RepID=A0A8D0BNN6_SALMN